jgi:hypothetical protein
MKNLRLNDSAIEFVIKNVFKGEKIVEVYIANQGWRKIETDFTHNYHDEFSANIYRVGEKTFFEWMEGWDTAAYSSHDPKILFKMLKELNAIKFRFV